MLEKIKNYINKNSSLKRKVKRMLSKLNFISVKKRVSGKSNDIAYKHAILRKTTFDVKGNKNSIIIMEGSKLENVNIFVRGNNNKIILHNNVRYNGQLCTECNNSRIEIGMDTTTEQGVIMYIAEDNLSIEVGSDCMFSSHISVWTQDWHPIYDENGLLINSGKSIIINNHVWVGYDVKILKGVTIGNNNIIGTDALVTKSFEDENVVIAGNPAKIVKRGSYWERLKRK